MKVGRLILCLGIATAAAPPIQRMDVRADGGIVGPGLALRLPPPFQRALVLGWDKR